MPPNPFTITKITQATPDIKLFSLKPIQTPFPNFVPGQFAMMYLPKPEEGFGEAKPYSIASAPGASEVELAIKIAGFFTQKVAKLREGETVGVTGPFGLFTFKEQEMPSVVFLAGGIGITPFMSAIRYAVEKQLENKITLLYSNKTIPDIAYRQEILEAAQKNRNIKPVLTLTRHEQTHGEWGGETGRINAEMVEKHVADLHNQFYFLCGPNEFIRACNEALLSLKIEPKKIKREIFG